MLNLVLQLPGEVFKVHLIQYLCLKDTCRLVKASCNYRQVNELTKLLSHTVLIGSSTRHLNSEEIFWMRQMDISLQTIVISRHMTHIGVAAILDGPVQNATQSLSFQHCYKFNMQSLNLALQKFPQLKKLDLSDYCSINDEAIINVCSNCLMLVSIAIKGCNRVSDQAIVTIANNCKSLEYLDISNCTDVTDNAIVHVANNCAYLTTLRVKNCKIDGKGIIAVAQKCKYLHTLDVSHTRLSSEAVQIISKIPTIESLRTIKMAFCHNVDNAAIIALATCCSALEALHIHGCYHITGDTISTVARFCRNLRVLSALRTRNITADTFHTIVSCCASLQTLKISEFGEDTANNFAVLSNCQHLRNMTVQLSFIATDNFVSLAAPRMISYCTAITALDLDECGAITDDSVVLLCTMLVKLTHFSISDNAHVTGRSLFALAVNAPGLEKFNLTNCPLVDDTSILVLTYSGKLRSLYLRGLPLLSNLAVAGIARRCKLLESLFFVECPAISDLGFEYMAEQFSQQEVHVYIFDCFKVSRSLISDLVQEYDVQFEYRLLSD